MARSSPAARATAASCAAARPRCSRAGARNEPRTAARSGSYRSAKHGGFRMRLLLINPNISSSVSDLILGEAQRSASPGTEVEVATAPFGVAYIETRFESLIGAYAAAQLAAEHHPRFDAIVVAAFGDPGLGGLREALPIPVTGMTEAALASAHLLGHRFSIIAISQRIQAWYREVVEGYGFGSRLASIRALDRPITAIGGVQQEHADALKAL